MSSFGELLKRERELRKISLREVSEATKINLRYLEALERNDFRHLPGGVFNKGFVRAYAQYIGVEPEGMIDAYLLEERSQTAESETSPQGDVLRGRRPVEPPPKDVDSISRGRQRVVVIVVGALLVVALVTVVVVWIIRGLGDRSGGEAQPAAPSLPTEVGPLEPAGAPAIAAPDEAIDAVVEDDAGGTILETSTTAVEEPQPRKPPSNPEPRPSGSTDAGSVPEQTSPAATAAHEVVVVFVRPTSGRVVCDRRVEMIDGRARGQELRLSCASILVVDVADGGGILIGVDGQPPRAVGADGEAIRGRDLLSGSRAPGAGNG